MNYSLTIPCCIALILALFLAMPVAAESSTISSVSPAVGYTGSTTSVTITGTNFNESSVKVKLMMDDESNITSTITSHSATEIVCKFTISSGKTTGDWDLVVINEDDSEVVDSEAFTIKVPMTLSAISPASARTNNDSVDFTLTGTGLEDVSSIILYKKSYDNVSATIDDTEDEEVTGSFDLTDVDELTYKVCVMDSYGTEECGLSFEVTSDAVGTLDVSTSPSGASVYLDNAYVGTSPLSIDDLDVGSHKLILKKSGYTDYSKLVKITDGDTTTVDATLAVVTTAPTTIATPVPTTVATIAPTAVKTTKKPVTTAETPWPASTTSTQESPTGPLVVIGAVGLALIRKC